MQKLKIILLLCSQLIFGLDSLQNENINSDSFFSRKNLSVAFLAGASASTLVSGYYMWWRDGQRQFSFYSPKSGEGWLNDPYSKGIDKIGHFYTSYFFYNFSKNLLMWGGYSERDSQLASAFTSFGIGLLIEIGDGFSRFGFDYQDLIFNTLGLGYGFLRDVLPLLQNFNFKWSYIPTHDFHFPPNLTSTYEAHIYWLTMDINNLLSGSIGNIWPVFLQPAIGFSVSQDYQRREYLFGLDFNLNKIFSTNNHDWMLIINTTNMLHYPAPGIKFSSGRKPDFRFFIFN